MADETVRMSMVSMAGAVFTLACIGAGFIWGVVLYLDGRRAASVKTAHEKIDAATRALADKIERVREDSVRREEWLEDRRRLEERFTALTQTIRETMQTVSARLETITTRIDQILTNGRHGRHGDGD